MPGASAIAFNVPIEGLLRSRAIWLMAACVIPTFCPSWYRVGPRAFRIYRIFCPMLIETLPRHREVP